MFLCSGLHLNLGILDVDYKVNKCVYIAGVHSWLHWRKELDVAADLLYFGLTTFGGLFQKSFIVFFIIDQC